MILLPGWLPIINTNMGFKSILKKLTVFYGNKRSGFISYLYQCDNYIDREFRDFQFRDTTIFIVGNYKSTHHTG